MAPLPGACSTACWTKQNLAFEGVSATSAGAMNAAAFAYGLAVDGREGARKALDGYWKRVSDAARLGPLQPTPVDRMLGITSWHGRRCSR